MANHIIDFIWDLSKYNLGPMAIFAAIIIGLWTMKLNLSDALFAKAQNKGITSWCWVFIAFWTIFFLLSLYKSRSNYFERVKKDSDLKEKKMKEEKDRSDRVTFHNEVKDNMKKLTEVQKNDFQSLSTEIGQLKLAQASTDQKINENMAEMSSSIDAIDDKMRSNQTALEEVAKDKIWSHNLINNLFSQKEKESLRRTSTYSSKSL